MDYYDQLLHMPLPTIIINAKSGNVLFANGQAKKAKIGHSFYHMLYDKAIFSQITKDTSHQRRTVNLIINDRVCDVKIAVNHAIYNNAQALIIMITSIKELKLRDEQEVIKDICDVFITGREKKQVQEFLKMTAQSVGAFCAAIYEKKNERFVLRNEWRDRKNVCIPVLSPAFDKRARIEINRFKKLKRAVDMEIVDYKNDYGTQGMAVYFFDAAADQKERDKLRRFIDIYCVMIQDSSKNDVWSLVKSGLDVCAQAFVIWDIDTKCILHENTAYKKMFGYNKLLSERLIKDERPYIIKVLTTNYTDAKGRNYSVTHTKTKSRSIVVTFIVDITEQKQAQDKLSRLAKTDMLTGLNNRRAGEEHLRRIYQDCKQKKKPLTVCFADIDGLKHINDTYGHGAGDVMIRSVADVLKKVVENIGIVCRLGGDEFVLILPNMNKAETMRLTERVEHMTKSCLVGESEGISMSFGYKEAEYSSDETAGQLISVADSEMYAEKRKKVAKS